MSEESKAKKMLKLTENPDFVELILDNFIRDGVLDLTLNNNIETDSIRYELHARRILHEYIMNIIMHSDNE